MFINKNIKTIQPIVAQKPIFFTGWSNPVNGASGCGEFEYCLVSVNRFVGKYAKKLKFEHKRIMLDSAAFTRVSGFYPQFKGHLPVKKYASIATEMAKQVNLVAIVTQDYMCEPIVLRKRKATVKSQQIKTIRRYDLLLKELSSQGNQTYLLPVLQGYEPKEYIDCMRMYGSRLKPKAWVGVGTICKRNGSPQVILKILQAIKSKRPDLRLHGFGLKIKSLALPQIQDLLYSADSAAASLAGGRGARKYAGCGGWTTNDPRGAIAYEIKIYQAYLKNCPSRQQQLACCQYLAHLQASIERISRRKADNL